MKWLGEGIEDWRRTREQRMAMGEDVELAVVDGA